MAHVDWRAMYLQCPLDDLNRTIDTGTKTAGFGEQNLYAKVIP
jgi:hypothetical protein